MKNHLLVSLLLVQFYLNAIEKPKSAIIKKQDITTGTGVLTITEHTIKGLLSAELGLLMIGADWCTHCKEMQPLFLDISQKYKNTAKYGFAPLGSSFSESTKLVRALEKKYVLQIDAIPMILVFKKNKLVDQVRGAVTREELTALLKKHASVCSIDFKKVNKESKKKNTSEKN